MASSRPLLKRIELDKHFAVLRLTPAASESEVRRAYRKLLMVWHPDRVAGSDSAKKQEAHERTRQLVAAYAVLREHFRSRGTRHPQAPVPRPTRKAKQTRRSRTHPKRARKSLLDHVWVAVALVVLLGGLADLLLWLVVHNL